MYAEGQIQTRILGHKNNDFPIEFCSKYSAGLTQIPCTMERRVPRMYEQYLSRTS